MRYVYWVCVPLKFSTIALISIMLPTLSHGLQSVICIFKFNLIDIIIFFQATFVVGSTSLQEWKHSSQMITWAEVLFASYSIKFLRWEAKVALIYHEALVHVTFQPLKSRSDRSWALYLFVNKYWGPILVLPVVGDVVCLWILVKVNHMKLAIDHCRFDSKNVTFFI